MEHKTPEREREEEPAALMLNIERNWSALLRFCTKVFLLIAWKRGLGRAIGTSVSSPLARLRPSYHSSRVAVYTISIEHFARQAIKFHF
jgi:hypothetical protein